MPDFGTPVAQNVNINPQQGIQTLSGLLGLKQQQLALQTGQAQLGTAQAVAQQEQQTAQQRANVATFMQHYDAEKHTGPDGTLDLDATFSDPNLRAAAGDQFPAIMQNLLGVKNAQLQAKQSLLNLNNDSRVQFEGIVGGLRTDKDVIADNEAGRSKVQNAIDEYSSTGPDAARAAKIYGGSFTNAPQGHLVDAVSNAQLQALDASAQASHQAPNYANTGTGLVNVNPQAVGGNLSGPPQQGPPQIPLHQPISLPNGQQAIWNTATNRYEVAQPGGPQSSQTPPKSSNPFLNSDGSARTATQDAPPANAPKQVQDQYAQSATAASQYVGQVRDADEGYGTNLAISNAIRRLSVDTKTGPGTQKWHDVLGALGAPADLNNVSDYQQLGAWLERQAAGMRQTLGLPQTNLGQTTAGAISGTTEYQPEAIQAKNDFNQALIEGLHSYRQGMDKVTGFGTIPSPKSVQSFRGAWTNNFDPTVYELKSAQQRLKEDPQAVQKVIANLTPEQAQEIRTKRKALQNLTIGQPP
jgi:hypothetical protein